jgi:hypothetical protein
MIIWWKRPKGNGKVASMVPRSTRCEFKIGTLGKAHASKPESKVIQGVGEQMMVARKGHEVEAIKGSMPMEDGCV